MGTIGGRFPVVAGWWSYTTKLVELRRLAGRKQACGLLSLVPVARPSVRTCVFLAAVLVAACASDRKKVDDANKAAGSWAATVKAVAEQWAQSRVSLRFTRTTLN